jgi:hypothetical protein
LRRGRLSAIRAEAAQRSTANLESGIQQENLIGIYQIARLILAISGLAYDCARQQFQATAVLDRNVRELAGSEIRRLGII